LQLWRILSIFARKQESINMATPVKIIPTLRGEAARTFIERAEERERNPRHIVIFNEKEERAYIEMMKRSGMPL
jgi:hypothetical protein